MTVPLLNRSENIHATAVALDAERGVLIRGASGSGKSQLALRLMAFGARLVSDDRTDLRSDDAGQLIASAPPELAGRIEARGVGILRADALSQARVTLCVDLDRIEDQRLPPYRKDRVLGVALPLVLQLQNGHLDVAILQFLKEGRWA
ncbi:serine kinase [Thioclava dalianensis]|uniref:Serine kinase n=1 Tax=Thioclava dalianensis TaxID=1185766 RepID=A0A074TJM1_9RHOB|nr:serine kinase [Thioclava dalianensis]KEP69178.1 serine kinase [Thioclava dalianensis]SFM91567.1 HPr kinase/phosphorylase [Thioclava dalianensis]